MTVFYGRHRELAALRGCYTENRFHLCVMYGRRRTGKTTLLNQFRQDKKHIYIVCQQGLIPGNLERFNRAISAAFPENGPAA
ncbi:ATP-binding protein [uncultured Sutterella sp.]|uniref:AAA family ATPase n=1 Tax=uncultured Sutterella sp. TaxID=286133 RepID=UPI00260DA41A|nr:ATP-binding protein [uncultured Sutterella sp.]